MWLDVTADETTIDPALRAILWHTKIIMWIRQHSVMDWGSKELYSFCPNCGNKTGFFDFLDLMFECLSCGDSVRLLAAFEFFNRGQAIMAGVPHDWNEITQPKESEVIDKRNNQLDQLQGPLIMG